METTKTHLMKPTAAILDNIRRSSKKNKEETFTRLFRYLLRPDIYYLAYENLYANNGAATKGVNNDTANGFSEKKVERIIQSLKDGSYSPSPVRRTYIPKRNGKLRPLGIPTFTDKLVQEALRMVLEAVYEPIFLPSSHGFRPNRSCHTALKDIKHGYPGVRWFVEGDIKGFFDHIDHAVLVDLIGKKVKDARITQLLHKMLKAGYLEDWKYNRTLSGTPQGGIISPLLANIYLHELDKFIADMKAGFDKPKDRVFTPEYMHVAGRVHYISRLLKKEVDPMRIQTLLQEQKVLRAQMLRLPAKSQTDKRINYVRYADDFLIGVIGSKEDCVEIKARIKAFLADKLKLELSDEKTLITVHFYRNVFSVVPRSKVKLVAKMLKAIHGQENKKAAREKAKAVVAQLKEMKLKEAARKVEDSVEETLTYCDFPYEHWGRIRTNNVIERLNREIRRRTRVVGTFPDGNSALMLVCARLRHVAGTQWGNKKYMNMKHLEAALEDVSIAG